MPILADPTQTVDQKTVRSALNTIPQQLQRQDSTKDQLSDLAPFVAHLGVPLKLISGARALVAEDKISFPRYLQDVLSALPSVPRFEASEAETLGLLRWLANRLGLLDAADYIRGLQSRPS